jgi:hypothetical protein
MINEAVNFAQEHRTVFAGASLAAVHFAHLAWPRLVAMFPYCRDHGGVFGIVGEFLHGKQSVASIALAAPSQPNQPLKEVV